MTASGDLSQVGIMTARAERKGALIVSLGVVFFLLLMLYAAILGVLLPNQIENIDPAGKTAMLGIVFAITSVFSTVTTPVSGALSDRTRTRFGRRTPWIVIGGVVGGIATILIPFGGTIVGVTAFWLVATVSLNSMQPAITTVVADRFAPNERGTVSGVVGASMTAGVSSGTIFGGLLAGHLFIAYAIIGGGIIIACLAFVLINPEPPLPATQSPQDPFRLGPFLRSFWISPTDHPDFAWAFFGRFSIYMGYQGILTYLLYILEDHIGASVPDARLWFQLYVIRDRGFMRDLIAIAKEQGAQALVFTVDMPIPGIRYRDPRSGMSGPHGPARRFVQALGKPGWAWDVGLRGRPHQLGNLVPVLGKDSGMEDYIGWLARNFDPGIRWKDLEWLREAWDGPLIIKGILVPADVRDAANYGAQGIVVSNHGGRQLDGAPSVARALPAIADAVGDRLTLFADGGVRSGLDVVRMLALGARGVLLGRAWLWALAAQGEAGVDRMVSMLEQEMRVVMTLAGCNSVAALDRTILATNPSVRF